MKRLTITICVAVMLVACNDKTETKVAAATVAAPKEEMPDAATTEKRWMEYMTPGEAHKWMASQDGVWEGEITMWMTPDAAPTKSVGRNVNKMVLGGRYQEGVHTGDFGGMPFEGHSTMAYDNVKKQFISTWIDNMGTGVMITEGTMDKATNTMTMKGKMMDPARQKEIDVKEVCRFIDSDNMVMEMYCAGPDGKEFKTMEIKSSRKKK
jgi:hypothetical protein